MGLNKAPLIRAFDRRVKVLDLKRDGKTDVAIGLELGVSSNQIGKDIKRVLGELARANVDRANEVRALQIERYEYLLNRCMVMLEASTGAAKFQAIETALKIMKFINDIWGLLPEKSLITVEMMQDNRQQNLQVNNGVSHQEFKDRLENDPEVRAEYLKAWEGVGFIPETIAGMLSEGVEEDEASLD